VSSTPDNAHATGIIATVGPNAQGFLGCCSDIRRAWKVAGKRYGATRSAAIAAIGPEYSIWEEMPSEEGEIVYFRGKAALPIHALGISSFSKAFFLAPGQQLDGGRGAGDRVALFGRVINPTALGNRVYPGPMYFRAAVGPTASSSERRHFATEVEQCLLGNRIARNTDLRKCSCCSVWGGG